MSATIAFAFWKNYMSHPGLYELVPGFVAGALGVTVVSFFGGARRDAVTAQFDRVMHPYAHHGHREWTDGGAGPAEGPAEA